MRAQFGRPVHRVALDAGSSCPNRDGTKGFGGCTYCDIEGSGTGAAKSGVELAEQLAQGRARIARRARPGETPPGVLAYFQSYSNTYVDGERLGEVLDIVARELRHSPPTNTTSTSTTTANLPPIVGVSLATRPDCLPEAALDQLTRLNHLIPVWVELGLESANDSVLFAINRLHTLAEFHDACRRIRARNLVTIGHAILGLPHDGREGAQRTAEALAEANVDGVKVHHLMVLRRTQLAHQWRNGEVEALTVETYVDWLADFIERLAPHQILHRITGDATPDTLLAPLWSVHKNEVRRLVSEELNRRGTTQGSHHHAPETRGTEPDPKNR